MRTREFHGHPDYLKLTEDELQLHSAKNKDYAKFGDPLGNFKRVSDILKIWGYNISPDLVALIFALKQQDAVMWQMSHGYASECDSQDERMADNHVYWKIARILRQQKEKE